jgi:hypothetical protein
LKKKLISVFLSKTPYYSEKTNNYLVTISRKKGRPSQLKIPVKQKDDFNKYHQEYRKVKKTTKSDSKPKPGTKEYMDWVRSFKGKKKKKVK